MNKQNLLTSTIMASKEEQMLNSFGGKNGSCYVNTQKVKFARPWWNTQSQHSGDRDRQISVNLKPA